jgi:hypothetical protein
MDTSHVALETFMVSHRDKLSVFDTLYSVSYAVRPKKQLNIEHDRLCTSSVDV